MSRDIGFIKWRLVIISSEIKSLMKRASFYHKQGNKTKLDETLTTIEKLKAERKSWFDALAEAETDES